MFCDDIFGETPTGVRKVVSFIVMLPSVFQCISSLSLGLLIVFFRISGNLWYGCK